MFKKAEVEEEESRTRNGKKNGRPGFLIAVMALVIVIIAAGGYYGYSMFKQRRAAVKTTAVAPQLQRTLDMGGVVVNLAGSTSRYLRISPVIVIKYSNEKKIEKELEEKKYEIKDGLLILLRSKTVYEISTAEGIESLKEQIAAVLNEILESGRVEEVYFTEFLLQ